MKKALFLSLILLGLTACDKDKPVVKPVEGKISLKSETSIVLSDDADSKQATFSATLAWTAASSESWLSVEPGSGEAGDATITISAAKNENYDPRTATVTLTCDKDTKTIQVTQKQKGALLLTESTIPVGAEGGTVVIVAKANANVSANIDAAAKEWISDITTKALIDYSFQFDVKANESEEARSGNIVFSNEYGSETVTIEQAAQTPANVFGKVTCNGTGVKDVLVSDGIDIVKTDANGNYRLQSDKKWKMVFMTIPSGYEAPLEGILPRFWKELEADANTAEEVDFELTEASNDNYTLLVLGDLHLARRTGDLAQFEKVAG
ncbi:MAG: hypothetical protein K5652_01060, partial [Bacteroidales bacterium]|nr:hypothetical protein [Bacteroidales bacterium]